ncbi:MAG: glycoside hydrolase family 2, partial [Flavisolibacter sp.]|nr:glycoside hydrolase family 2 [Flavisolibacter sp.]
METNHPNYGLSKSREEASITEEAIVNPLPRAVLRSNSFVLLDGEWHFAIDPDDRGLREGWYLGHQYEHTANWPGSIEEHMAAAKGQKPEQPWHDKIVAWYEREFTFDSNNRSPFSMLQLTFGACGYETRVWLNGLALHTIEGEEVHKGEYTSFSYELPEYILKPVNRLTVRISDTMDADIPRGKQES